MFNIKTFEGLKNGKINLILFKTLVSTMYVGQTGLWVANACILTLFFFHIQGETKGIYACTLTFLL